MTNKRIHENTRNKKSITTALSVVVMLLFFIGCGKEKTEVIPSVLNPDSIYMMRTTDATSLISDSGYTRYRLTAPEWLMYSRATEPYWYFPKGAYLEKFDTLFNVEATVVADTVTYFDKKRLWELVGNVHIENVDGTKFDSQELYLDERNDKVSSTKHIRIEQKDGSITTGIGFESNMAMTDYHILSAAGEFIVSETKNDTTATVNETADSVAIKTDSIKK